MIKPAANDLTNHSPAVEVESSAVRITNHLYHPRGAGSALPAIESIARTRGVQGFACQKFLAELETFFAEPAVRRELDNQSSADKQYVITSIERSDVTGNSIAVLPDDLQARVPATMIAGLDRLKLRFDLMPKRSSLLAMWNGPDAAPGG